jgi:hypothetical protein
MNSLATTELVTAAAAAAVVGRLIQLNLAGRFPAFLAYLVLVGLIYLSFGLLSPASNAYFWSYVILEPLKWILSIFVIRELFAMTFHRYPGIRTVGRWATYAGVALSLAISLLAARLFWGGGPRGSADLFYFEVSQRSVVFTLAFVIVTILLILSKYPLHLSRNTLVSSVFFSVLFLSEAFQLLIDSLSPNLYNIYADWTEVIFLVFCLLGWGALLGPELAGAPERVAFPTPSEDHLLQQLDALNQMMTRAARR